MTRPRHLALCPDGSLFEALRGDLAEFFDDHLPTCTRERPEIRLMRCPLDPNTWAPAGSFAAGRCLCCNTPFPKAA